MILLNFTTVLTVLLFATPIADADRTRRCNLWKTCYNRIQQQENSALQQTVMKINRTLSNQRKKIGSLQTQKDEMNNTIFNQTKIIQQQLYEQARQVAEKLSVMSNKLEDQANKLEEQSNKIKNQGKTIEELQKILLGKAKSCKNIKDLVPSSVSGIYWIEVDGEKLEVRCEMNSASGGWTVFHRRYDGSVNFNRSWTSFEQGFGELNGEFWMGLKNLNKLTKSSVFLPSNDLRIEMSSFDGVKKYAEYKEFHVADSSLNYRLLYKEGSYSGDAGDAFSDRMWFSTFDNDNDLYIDKNCAADYGANWWGEDYGRNNINGRYGGYGDSGLEFMHWFLFDRRRENLALKSMTLMFRQAD